MRYRGATALDGDSAGGGGPLAVPGRYRVRLSTEGLSAERDLELLIDPRVAAAGVTVADLAAQLELALRLRDAISQNRAAVRTLRALTEQVKALEERAAAAPTAVAAAPIVERAETLRQEIGEIEATLVQTEKGKVGAELEPQLDDQLDYLNGMITGADQRPGADAYVRFDDLGAELEAARLRLEALLAGPVAELNGLVRELELPALVPPRLGDGTR